MYSSDFNTAQTITFTYDGSKLMDNVSLRSAYKARTVAAASGTNAVDELSISDDEKDAFKIGVESTLPDIYEMFLKLTSGVDDAYDIDSETMAITIKIQNNKAYNENVIKMVDASVLDCLINGSLMRWYETCAHADFQAEYATKYVEALRKLSGRIFQLKKKVQSSNLGETSAD